MIFIKKHTDANVSLGQMNFIFNERMLLRDLATWIRAYLVSTYDGLGNQEAVKERLYRLPIEYNEIFKLFFGDQIANKYTDLLFASFTMLESFITAEKNDDADAANEYIKQIYENADQRADFLSQINPFWQASEWKPLMYDFIRLTIDESTSFLTKDYNRNISTFDRILSLSTKMGDYYSDGLYKYITYSNGQPLIPKQWC